MATETMFLRALKRFGIRVLVDGFWTVLVFHPFFVFRLWGVWWLRPIIVWYSPLTLYLILNFLLFSSAAIFCFIIKEARRSPLRPFLMKCQFIFAYIYCKIMHGTEVYGLQNLPKGGGLVVYYHAPFFPIDLIYLFSYVFLKFGRMIGGAVERNMHQNSFFGPLVEFYEFTSHRKTITEDLRNGQLRSVAPGGAYEAMFSENYSVEWQSRIGFAQVAKETGVPVVPMFTSNVQHSIVLTAFNRSDTMKKWYALTKRPVCVIKCYLPAKMRIYLGEPLICGKSEEPVAFAQRVREAIEALRDKHQPPHQTCLGALGERLW